MDLGLQELEAAINHWRARKPAQGAEFVLSAEVNALARVYALMIFHRRSSIPFDSLEPFAQQLVRAWRDQSTHA
ncbi:MAG TPA: DUF3717 domain-containing protein [Telluria sp.]|nr:DUF3717 domain-containing protein [Telluria sp.]